MSNQTFYCPQCQCKAEFKKENNGKRCLECGSYFGETFTLKDNPILQQLLQQLKSA